MEETDLIRFYILTSQLGNMVYVGLTNKTIQKRFNGHLSAYKPTVSKITSFDLFDEYSVENCKISELSSKMCDKKERDDTENQYIEQYKADNQYKCVNKMRAGVYSANPKNWKQVRCACGDIYVGSEKAHQKQSGRHQQNTINININISK